MSGTLSLLCRRSAKDVLNQSLQTSGKSDGWHRIAYAFLRLAPSSTYTNAEKKQLRLQLYQYPRNIAIAKAHNRIPHVYRCWRTVTASALAKMAFSKPLPSVSRKKRYDGTLYVTICGKLPPPSKNVTRRPLWAGEVEIGKIPYEDVS